MSRFVELVIRRVRVRGGKKRYLVRGDNRHGRGCFGLCFPDLAMQRLAVLRIVAEVSTQSFLDGLERR